MAQKAQDGRKIVATNHKAGRDYFIEGQWEAGLALAGHEVKSLREGKANIQDGFVRIENNEAFLYNITIPPYAHISTTAYDPAQKRKLLLHRTEINRIFGLMQKKGYAAIPLEIYFRNGRAKASIGLGKGKKLYDKRETIKKREVDRDLRRAFRGRNI
jgi:SsrA-binding protein